MHVFMETEIARHEVRRLCVAARRAFTNALCASVIKVRQRTDLFTRPLQASSLTQQTASAE
jgi:hypothetical protein